MFRNLFGLSHRRTAIEAVGFYLAYLAVGLLLSAAVGSTMDLLGPDPVVDLGFINAGFVTVYVATGILRSRRLLASPLNVAVWLLAFVGAVYGGLILGLVFPAFLSTRPDGPAKTETLTIA